MVRVAGHPNQWVCLVEINLVCGRVITWWLGPSHRSNQRPITILLSWA